MPEADKFPHLSGIKVSLTRQNRKEKLKNGDKTRLEIVEILPKLRQFAYSITGARSDADDLLQATVEKLLSKGIPSDANIDKWAFRVCKNIYIDDYRSRKVRLKASVSGNIGGENSIDGDRVIMGQITFAKVNKAMKELPDEQRTALSLVALKGYTYAEVAEALDMPIGTVMSRIARARRSLSKSIEATNKNGTDYLDKSQVK